MSETVNMNDPIEKKLYEAWKQERRFYHLRGLSRFLIWALGLLIIDLLIDWGVFFQARLSGHMAMILLVINIAILAYVFWREWWRYLKPFNAVNMALEVEGKHPELLSRLVSYTQLSGDKLTDQDNVSIELIQAMRDQALDLSKPLDFREVVDFKQLKNLMITAVSIVIFFSAISINWTGHMKSLILRMTGSNVNYPTQTQIIALTKETEIPQGGSVNIIADAGGKIPDSARIYVRSTQESDFHKLKMDKSNVKRFSREFNDVYEDMEFYVKVGDAQSRVYKITVVPAPKVQTAVIAMSYPKYMNKPATQDKSGNMSIDVPEGTKLNWQLTLDRAVESLKVVIGNKEEIIDAAIGPDGKTASFDYAAEANFKYTFKWVEKKNGFEYSDVNHAVRVMPDGLPEVELLQPSSDSLATVNKTLRIFADASDDYGLGEAHLVYSVDGHKEERILIQDLAGKINSEITYSWDIKKSIPDLKEGVTISYYIEVRDKYPKSDTHFRNSASLKLNIVSETRYLAWIRELLAAQQEEIVKAKDSEEESSSKVKTLIKLEGK